MESPDSSAWKKPSDVMRLVRRRKSSACRRMSNDSPRPVVNSTSPGRNLGRCGSTKRRNPFGCSPRKRCNLGETHTPEHPNASHTGRHHGDPTGVLFDVLNSSEEQHADPAKQTHGPETQVLQLVDGRLKCPSEASSSSVLQPAGLNQPTTRRMEGSATCPLDWSLKTKVRFLSKKTFAWCTPLRTVEESSGIRAFASCSPEPRTSEEGPVTIADKSELQRHCLYWQHPSLPWCKLFPRITSENKIGKPGTISSDESILSCLLSEWVNSFTSVFQLLRCHRCPYFYLCTHQFTVLFRAAGVGGRSQCHALITPTTRGFREALSKEGIEFTLPLFTKKRPSEEGENSKEPDSSSVKEEEESSSTGGKTRQGDEDEDEDDLAQTDEGASSFLESIGLDTSRFKSLDPDKVKLSREGFRTIDHRPESLVLVEGADTQALYNYLLNCRSCVAAMGSQLGIPPTLIAPVCFKGATLKSLKVKAAAVRHQMSADQEAEHGFAVEVSGGPILPCNLQGLTALFSCTQGQYTASFSTHEPMAPFNGVHGQGDEENPKQGGPQENTRNWGLTEGHSRNIGRSSSGLKKQGIRELQYKAGLFTWNS